MCRQCEPKCHSKKTTTCTKTKVICHLPYPITKSGHYCLGKDFTWSDSTQSAIKITADNVVLDFNHRLIETTVATTNSVVSADGVKDLVLNNVHIKAVGDAEYSAEGIDVIDSNNVYLKSASLINLSIAFFTDRVNGLVIDNLYLKNEVPIEDFGVQNLLLNNSDNIKFHDSFTSGARCILRQCISADVRNIETSGLVFQECLRVDSLNGGKDQSFDFSVPPLRISEHIRITNNIFRNIGRGIGVNLAGFVNAIPNQEFQYPVHSNR